MATSAVLANGIRHKKLYHYPHHSTDGHKRCPCHNGTRHNKLELCRLTKARKAQPIQEMTTIVVKWLRQAPDWQGGHKHREVHDAAITATAPTDQE